MYRHLLAEHMGWKNSPYHSMRRIEANRQEKKPTKFQNNEWDLWELF